MFRRPGRELDRDNLIGGCKWLRDVIAEWLGIDDSERCIDWSYSQHTTRGQEGVGVKIEVAEFQTGLASSRFQKRLTPVETPPATSDAVAGQFRSIAEGGAPPGG